MGFEYVMNNKQMAHTGYLGLFMRFKAVLRVITKEKSTSNI